MKEVKNYPSKFLLKQAGASFVVTTTRKVKEGGYRVIRPATVKMLLL